MYKKSFCFLFLLLPIFLFAQKLKSHEYERTYMRIMFYNVENLFDIYDDSLKRDDEFTSTGKKYWTKRKYKKKLNNISKVIIAVGQWEAPEIVGLCEIENRIVLEGITKRTALKKIPYRIIHKESPDKRGIDVALLYRKDKFTVIDYEALRVVFPFDANRPTRDILYVKGYNTKKDTLHIFVNHWPSRWGGQTETDRKRVYVASVLRKKTDSLFNVDINPKIIIMGDLNDYPDNNSLIKTLEAKTNFDNINNKELYNLAYYMQNVKGEGSHKYEGKWGVLDQIIVSGILLDKNQKLRTSPDDAHVFNAPFLLERDENYTGYRTFRTYIGFRFHDGFSDHLPVYIDLKID